ncbi:type VII secretion system-associated protein [Streptomyces sp. STR69]|uniref:type VII secretion system-associated protein n=1 Tax=Streptomyces sp. STR69 TaxID=1796942 RepID=UPI0021C8B224|nr:type VII secretion system-associated protein [Streptomyces sp. STR69]
MFLESASPVGERSEELTPSIPVPPDDIIEAARLAPDHWLSMIDPAWPGDGPPPDWAVIGRWRSGPTGEIEEWEDNAAYRPSPESLGWPEPADDVDAAVQLAATGYGPTRDVPRALADSVELAVFLAPSGTALCARAPDGTAVVPVFTAARYLHLAGNLAFEVLPGTELVDRIPDGHHIYLNPSAPVALIVETEALAEAVTARAARA